MRFISLLEKKSWRAEYGSITLSPEKTRQIVESVCAELSQKSLNKNKLNVFCFYTPLQALLYYFIASYLGLTAVILSCKSLDKLDEVDDDLIDNWVIPEGVKLSEKVDPDNVLKISLSLSEPHLTDFLQLPKSAENQARFVFFTSGSTGKPKKVIHNEETLLANAQLVTNYMGLKQSDRTYCVFPVNYMYGLSTSLCSLISGGYIKYKKFVEPALLAQYAQNEGITVLPILSEWSKGIKEQWELTNFSPDRLILINASDKLLTRHAKDLMPWATAFWNNMGQTESAPRLFAINLMDSSSLESISYQGLVSVGCPVHNKIDVRRENISEDYGKLFYKTPFIMVGYLQNNGEIVQPEPWIDSGDLFYINEDNVYFLLRRANQEIKINGSFISLSTISNQLISNNLVSNVAFLKDSYGYLKVFAEVKNKTKVLYMNILSLLEEMTSSKKIKLQLIHHLPRYENGKIDLFVLSEMNSD